MKENKAASVLLQYRVIVQTSSACRESAAYSAAE